jgi:hypothetical protein
MKIHATAVIATALLCAVLAVSAQTAAPGEKPLPGHYTVYGAGTESCGKWLAEKNVLLRNTTVNWLLGYVTAMGTWVPLSHTDSDAMAAWVDKYCRENPLKGVSEAAAALVFELAKPM